ncbi:PTS ascorbate transporter subunit IIC [Scandinavium goeteborgense]|uniref:Ascorbate-specific PTS system EIIC component n=1 Tax=Scandinavium goeteborgense TaxID=1851514 RepID=A0A4R6DT46_SCAGO|nr:PTS ascorbate transporter subunit IIC [Scandinavium goeteborgense]TDN47438.1 PTS system ascorbate-specific IIC component [Scandinavium goeteborgense]
MTDIIHFIIFQILDKAPLFLGIIALFGLILQRKKASEVIDGTVKTIVGLLVITIGSGTLLKSLSPIMGQLNTTLGIHGVLPANEAAFGVAMLKFANDVTLTFILGFLFHLFFVYIIPFKRCKNVFLTVHIQLFLATFMVLAIPGALGLSGMPLILTGAVLCGLYWTLSPAITRKLGQHFIGDDLTLGHNQQVGAWVASKIAPLFGHPSENAEELKLPGFLSMFRDNTISLAFLMPLIFLGIGFSVGAQGITELSGKSNWVVWLLMQGLSFTAGVVILLIGVRMFIGSIVPAFKGISDRLLPDAVPALDCPALFPYSPTGAMLGFIASVAGALLVTAATILLKSPIIVFPSPIIMFFDGCTMGVFGNKYGGYKGALAAGFITSIIAHAGVILLYPMMGSLYGSGLMFSNIDFSLVWLPLLYLLKLIGTAFGLVV